MAERIPTDESTLDGGTAVSGSLLARVADDVGSNRETLARHGAHLESINNYAEKGSTAQIEIATLMRERERRSAEEAVADREAAALAAERQDATRDKVLNWFGENWKVLGLGLILILNPASMGKLYELGLLAPFGVPAPAMAAPVAVAPVAAAPVMPVVLEAEPAVEPVSAP